MQGMWIEILTWIFAGVALVGTISNIYKRKWCWYFWISSNFFWTIINWFYYHAYSQSVLLFAYFLLSIWGVFKWARS
jgi:hypothetical protein